MYSTIDNATTPGAATVEDEDEDQDEEEDEDSDGGFDEELAAELNQALGNELNEEEDDDEDEDDSDDDDGDDEDDDVSQARKLLNEEIRDLEAAVAKKNKEIASSNNPLIRVCVSVQPDSYAILISVNLETL
jgi:transcription initiation factor TFIID subunit 7